MKKLFTLLSLTTALLINAKSPYISKVYDFVPAPGQFVNAMPEYEEGDDKASMLLKVEEQICGDKNPGMISLGAWGGYVVFGFDHPVVNVKDQYDFKIYGNAFIGNQATSNGGSCEPGIVLVSYDENGNGMPDDKWYELAGSEYAKESTIHDYKLTYYKPEANHEAQSSADDPHIIDVNYIKWTDNKGGQGYVEKNVFNSQDYWPLWLSEDSLTFSGCRLEDNAYDQSGNGTYYVQNMLGYGYVDNIPNVDDQGFKIDWAVDETGKSVHLPAIHFVKVYNAINQTCGWIGETSTEVCGGEDLHPNAELSGIEDIMVNQNSLAEYYNLQGIKVENPQNGIIIKKQGGKVIKVRL